MKLAIETMKNSKKVYALIIWKTGKNCQKTWKIGWKYYFIVIFIIRTQGKLIKIIKRASEKRLKKLLKCHFLMFRINEKLVKIFGKRYENYD